MPIIAPGKMSMQSSINAAFVKAKDAGAKDGASPDTIIKQLSEDIAGAVDAYVTSITVTITANGVFAGANTGGPVVGPVISAGSS